MSIAAVMLSMFLMQDAPPDSTLSKIVFYREYRFQGGAGRHKIIEGDSTVGMLKNNSFFTFSCKPGDYDFQVKHEKRSSIHLKVEATKTYYVHFVFSPNKYSIGLASSIYPDLELVVSSHALPSIERIKSTSKNK
jgi:hypothetical protein